MFAGGRRRSSNNVRAMQLFHELKQQFPTIPDHVVSACISSDDQGPVDDVLREVLEAAASLQQELMGRNPSEDPEPPLSTPERQQQPPNNRNSAQPNLKNTNIERAQNDLGLAQKRVNANSERSRRHEMNQSESDLNRNIIGEPKKPFKRPDTLEIGDSCKIRQSDKCKDVHKLLNSNKPPKSPSTPKRLPGPKPQQRSNLAQQSDFSDTEVIKKTEPLTVETPTQTTNSLISPSGVNLSLNVNCSMDLRRQKHTTALHVVPQQPWCQDIASARSYTSVNLTLRPPSSEPQAPIDITSQNSSLTYSTSTFDPQKGLQSKLQITVSPTGGGVSSIRTRPRSFHMEESTDLVQSNRVGSLPNLSTSPVLMRQQARIDKLRIELKSEKMRLVAMQTEVSKLEGAKNDQASERTDAELEKQLLREIRHLSGQCERLTIEVDRQTETGVPLGETSEEFYKNIYKGQMGPLDFTRPPSERPSNRGRTIHRRDASSPPAQHAENFGPKWSCPMCTFQNHPLLDECEQCNMARIVHGTKSLDRKANRSLTDMLEPLNIVNAANSLLQFVTSSNSGNPPVHRKSAPGQLVQSRSEGDVVTENVATLDEARSIP